MSAKQDGDFNPAPAKELAGRRLRDDAEALLLTLQANLDALDKATPPTQRIANELQILIDEIRQAVADIAPN